MQNKTFRLFISSPFSDFEKEREVLHKKVFPKIEKYCSKHHLSFQPVDLRWGVNDEAQYDQKTLEVCLEEVRACKHFPHPNFLIMAGDRYGYIPLPYMIEEYEFKKIEAHLNKVDQYNYLKILHPKANLKLLKSWYKLDTNQIPPSYILKERTEEYKDYSNWAKQEIQLRKILQEAAKHIFKSVKDRESKEYKKYFLSATEAEVEEGIISYIKPTPYQEKELLKNNESLLDMDPKHIFGFFRDIDKSTQIKNKFIQNDYAEAQSFKERVSRKLLDNNILHVQTTQKDEKSLEESYLKDFEKRMITFLEEQIDEQVNESKEISELEQEISEQTKFLKDKVKGFQGREKTLDTIENYLVTDTTEPLIIHGPSGMGKSSLMSEAIFRTDKNRDKENKKIDTDALFRFVGATANSTTIRNLLISIADELQDKKIIEQIDEYEVDAIEFETQIKDILLSIEKKTKTTVTIFIDALDQLQHINYLNWFPGKLPSNLKIILTVLNDKKYAKDTHYYKVLSSRYNNEKRFIDITKDSLEEKKEKLIKDLLEVEHRKLNKAQKDYLLEQWEKSEYSPLYLKIAIEEVKHWKHCEDKYGNPILCEKQKLNEGIDGDGGIISEYLKNLTSHYHHEPLLIKKVFGYIHVSKDGLSEKELLQILSEDLEDDEEFKKVIINEYHEAIKVTNPRRDNKDEHILPISIWSRLHTQIKPFIIERNIDGQPLMKFFHRQFNSVVEQYIKNEKTKLHTKLAEYFFTLQDTTKTWGKRYNDLHMLDELPYHLFHSNNSEKLKEILFDLEFTGSVYDHHKQDAFLEILGKASALEGISIDDIYPWKSFYLDNQYKIMMFDEKFWKPHQTLYQLAYEDGFNSPLTKKAYELFKNGRIDFVWSRNSRVKPEYTRTNRVQSKELNITLDDDSSLYIDDEKIAIVKATEASSNTFMIQMCFDNNLNEIKDFQALSVVNEDENSIKEEKLNIESFFSGETFNVETYKTLNSELLVKQFNEKYLDEINRSGFVHYTQLEFTDILDRYEIHVLNHVEKLCDNSLLIQYDENYYDVKVEYYDGYEYNYIVVVDIDQIYNVTTIDEIEQYVSIDTKYKDNILFLYNDILFATPRINIISFDIDVHVREYNLLYCDKFMFEGNIKDFISLLPPLPQPIIIHDNSSIYEEVYLCSSDKQYIELEDAKYLENIVYIGHECFTVNEHIGGYKDDDYNHIEFIPGNVYSLNGKTVYKAQDRILDVKTNKDGELIILSDKLIEIHQIKQINENISNHFSKITNFADFEPNYDFNSPNVYLAGNEFITVCRSEGQRQHFSIKLHPEILDFNLTPTEYENAYFNSANIFFNEIDLNPTTSSPNTLACSTFTPEKEFRVEDLSFEPIGYTNLNDKYLDFTIEGATISTALVDSYDFFEKTLFYRAEHYILPNKAKKEYIVYNVPKRIKNTRSQDSLSRPIQLLKYNGVQMTVNIPREVSEFTDFITIPLLEGAFYILIDSNLNVDIYEIMNGTSMSSSMKPWLDPVKRGITDYSLIKMYLNRIFGKKFLKDQLDLFRNGRMSDNEFVQTEKFFTKNYHNSEYLESVDINLYTLFQFWEELRDIRYLESDLTLEDFENKPEEIILSPYGWLSNANNLLNRFSEIKEEFGIRELREISLFEIDAFIDYLSSQKYNEALEEFNGSLHEDEYEIIQISAKNIHKHFLETIAHNIEKLLTEKYSFRVDKDQDSIGFIDSAFDPETVLQELTYSDLLGLDFDEYLTLDSIHSTFRLEDYADGI